MASSSFSSSITTTIIPFPLSSSHKKNSPSSLPFRPLNLSFSSSPPIMCITIACHILGVPCVAFPMACALEMVHASSLIHNDLPCMDIALFCCGRPTNHALFGMKMAILANDTLLPLGFSHIIFETPKNLVPEETFLRVVVEIARMVRSQGMAARQFLGLKGRNGGEEDVMLVFEKKFAECLTLCEGLLGGAEGEVLESLRR